MLLLLFLALTLILYIYLNDRKISRLPNLALTFSPHRLSPADVRAAAAKDIPTTIKDQIPPKTGRRYIIVGGGGFLGGWIVSQLLERGEDPARIRILDLYPSSRKDFESGPASKIAFVKVDITDSVAIDAAFKAPWPESSEPAELTVFHTAANIRFYERHPDLVERSARVNVQGTQNVIDAAQAVGASVLVFTSSGSVAIRRSRLWLWPWEREPQFFVQTINDVDDAIFPKQHDQFFSNYAFSKLQAERIARAADKTTTATGTILRTGCLRPGNGVYGPGDIFCDSYLKRSSNPTWVATTLQSFTYVENCACAHLCYERRLIDLSKHSCTNPDIGGQSFVIADPGPPMALGDVYTILETLTDGETYFTRVSATMMLILSHLVELYYVIREVFGAKIPFLRMVMPPISGDIINLQPSLFSLMQVHLIFDDSRARLPPEKGGLGYQGAWTTVQGLHRTYREHKKGFDNNHHAGTGGVSLDFKFFKGKAQKGQNTVELPPKVPAEVATLH